MLSYSARTRRVSTCIAILGIPLVVGCDDPGISVPATSPHLAPLVVKGQSLRPEDEWARLAVADLPGFAGLYLHDGVPVAMATNYDRRNEVVGYVSNLLRQSAPGNSVSIPVPEFRVVKYDARELRDWRDALLPLLDGEHIVQLDLDEENNRVFAGIPEGASVEEISQKVAAYGLPQDAYVVENVALLMPSRQSPQTIRDSIRPLVRGGFEIRDWPHPNGVPSCTLGFNAYKSFPTGAGYLFVTASHCTSTPFASDGINFRQPNDQASYIGWELHDPPLTTSGPYPCWVLPTGCRYSDAALGFYGWGPLGDVGRIARLQSFAVGIPTPIVLDINQSEPYWNIVWKVPNSFLISGRWVDKVGRRTGWTRGQITNTCVDMVFNYGAGNFVLLCQYRADYYADTGDSGGPVVFVTDGGDPLIIDAVGLIGIHFAGPDTGLGGIFSTVNNIEADISSSYLPWKVCNWQNNC